MDNNGRIAVAMLALSATGLVYLAQREDYRSGAYRDIAGVPTLGYGSTAGVKPGDTTTPARALVRLRADAGDVELAIKRCVQVPLHPWEFDALVALGHNVGPRAVCRSSADPAQPALIDLVNARRYAEACERIKAFNKYREPATGQLVPSRGLTNAREREAAMCRGEKVL